MHTQNPSDELIIQPNYGRRPDAEPRTATPMIVDIDQIDFYDRNPRRAENPQFENIKNDISASGGVDWVINITRRPGAENYMTAAGGNSTLRAVKELLQETGDTCFQQVHCLYVPWTNEDNILLAHLKENDQRGDLIFIDRARAVRDLRVLIETETGESLSQKRFAEHLRARGYNIGRTMLGWLDYAVNVLYPVIPFALEEGMGKLQVTRLYNLERAFNTAWAVLELEASEIGGLFTGVLERHDCEFVDPDIVRKDLQAELMVSADCEYEEAGRLFDMAYDDGLSAERIRTELARIPEAVHFVDDDGPPQKTGGEQLSVTVDNTGETFHADRPVKEPKPTHSNVSDKDNVGVISPDPVAQPEPISHSPDTPLHDPSFSDHPRKPGLAAPTSASTALPDDLGALRRQAFDLACVIAAQTSASEIIKPIDAGYGFLVGPLPDGVNLTNAYSSEDNSAGRRAAHSLWWMLATISEQFGNSGGAIPHIPPDWEDREIGEAMRQSKDFHIWQINNLVSQEVPYIPLPHLGSFGLNALHDQSWDDWVELVDVTRRILKLTSADPWK